MNSSSPHRQALMAFVGLILVWAYSWIIMKQVMRDAGPFDFAALRYLGGALVLFAALAVRRQSLKPPPLGLTLAVGLCQTTAFQALSQWALVTGGAGNVSMLAYTMPFWVVLIAWWLLDEQPSARQWLGIGLAAAGLIFIMQPWRGLGSLFSAFMAVTGGVGWALGTVLSKRMFERHNPSPLSFTAWQMLLGALALCLLAWWVPERPIAWTPRFIYGLVYSIVMASSLAWLLWLFVLKNLPTTIASLSSLCVPMTAIFMAWLILHERPNAAEAVGMILIVLGLVAVTGVGRRRR